MVAFDPAKLQVKNKMPAAVQITAEQILRDAVEWQSRENKQVNRTFVDQDELVYYKAQRRKEFEDKLRRQRHHMGTWIKYALWEANQQDFRRARSVFERALQVDPNNVNLWLRYIETEMKNKNVNAARNLFDRVVSLLPRVDQFWFKYAHFEELLGNYAGARTVFERWMEWNPDDRSWMLYIKFEERCGELDRCRQIFERFLESRPSCASFLKFAKFEQRQKNYPLARAAYVKCLEIIPPELLTEEFFLKFAAFETQQGNLSGAEKVYEQGLGILPRESSEQLYRSFVSFQKQHRDRETIDNLVVTKRRNEYEEQLIDSPCNYDIWFDYIRMEEQQLGPHATSLPDDSHTDAQRARVCELYERAISNLPQVDDRRLWRRYSYLWVGYAIFSELTLQQLDRAVAVYRKALQVLPKDFAKFYILLAELYLRQGDLDSMRKTFGLGLGQCKKPKLFETYAQIELKLGNLDRCRHIHAKYIETWPFKPESWLSFIELELMLNERKRVRGLCEAAIAMDQMDMPETVWNRYIEIEREWQQYAHVRNIYERLLLKTTHIKVFLSYCEFEFTSGFPDNARAIAERALEYYKASNHQVERAGMLAHLLKFERTYGNDETISKTKDRQPKKVRRKRKMADGTVTEDIVYIFPEDGVQQNKLLQAAMRWKSQANVT
ncbi:tetratricopeptide repeat (TPR) domain containing protein [Babesia bovis T2Bo]|uniref:Tetratricopeptide repeat domain containing protein n=1 Tax=Babesia bovis TaxID=5865 RepID=A7ANA4_BABBO|nr:tetratricopeptide repeat (TPR) domain containing protein [Babesia bovis T2Bo]EDO08038.1 tetratricopeptide repeat (TPR) domain containing protein [Babesia bovis T2Bo]|eukprot:XP_001611606.1 tetratricopeptide repeat domain containing protein [Babesia bovis T2Bo]